MVLNIPAKINQGVNFKLRTVSMPLYIKFTEYINRDYWYRRLTKQITTNCVTDKEKVLATLKWVAENIHDTPEGFDIIDDHTLNIIIRRYGKSDQMADVFTTLSVYSGIRARFRFEKSFDGTKHMVFSYVLLDGEWKVFDVYRNVYFLNDKGEIASIEDVILNPSIDTSYKDFFINLAPIDEEDISKAERQVPFTRIKYEIKRLSAKIPGLIKPSPE